MIVDRTKYLRLRSAAERKAAETRGLADHLSELRERYRFQAHAIRAHASLVASAFAQKYPHVDFYADDVLPSLRRVDASDLKAAGFDARALVECEELREVLAAAAADLAAAQSELQQRQRLQEKLDAYVGVPPPHSLARVA